MSKKILIKKSILITSFTILILSILLNIAATIRTRRYQYKVGLEVYNSLEDIRTLHDNNSQLLFKAIDSGSIDNMGILKLYKNYSNLAEKVAKLWSEYIDYEENSSFIISKKNIDTSDVTVNDINSKLEDFFNEMLELEMQTQSHKVKLEGKVLENFLNIYDLESEKNYFYNEFCENQLNGAVQDDKKNIIIKNHYWIDILNGYNDINKKYIDNEYKLN